MFQRFADLISHAVGTPWAFLAALISVLLWIVSGPLFGFSDTWQLVINTATTVVTFWMVFLIQATQNRDNKALHVKLDDLLLRLPEADSAIAGVERLSERELDARRAELELEQEL